VSRTVWAARPPWRTSSSDVAPTMPTRPSFTTGRARQCRSTRSGTSSVSVWRTTT
jgi:hypothetical protein